MLNIPNLKETRIEAENARKAAVHAARKGLITQVTESQVRRITFAVQKGEAEIFVPFVLNDPISNEFFKGFRDQGVTFTILNEEEGKIMATKFGIPLSRDVIDASGAKGNPVKFRIARANLKNAGK